MHNAVAPPRRRLLLAAAAVALALSGCGVLGGLAPGTSNDPEPAPTAEPAPTPTEPAPTQEPPAARPVAAETPEAAPEEPDAATPEDAAAGTVELSIESGGTERVFEYTADHCVVTPEYILVSAAGAEVGTGTASEVGIGTSPAELLHEATGTFQADGIISVRTGGEEVVSDGRMITVEGNRISSAFTYRHDENSAHFVVAWFSGASQLGAGYVKVNCNY